MGLQSTCGSFKIRSLLFNEFREGFNYVNLGCAEVQGASSALDALHFVQHFLQRYFLSGDLQFISGLREHCSCAHFNNSRFFS